MTLPHGVVLTPLTPHRDDRGTFVEAFRASWSTDIVPVQWNVVTSGAGVLRGVHVHRRHADYLTVLAGAMVLGLHDLRRGSPTEGRSAMLTIEAEEPRAVTIPPGVAHGFCFPVPSVHLYAVSHYWNKADELGCRYDDPDLGLDWPITEPMLSPRDAAAGTLAKMERAYEKPAYQAEPVPA